jgi:Helix-turn-helix domain
VSAGVGTPPDSNLGTLLRSRRQAQGLTLAQASAATRVRAVNLAAIEDGEMRRLAAPVYARGYVRAYARYLGLDPDEIVAMIPSGPPDPQHSLAIEGSSLRPRVAITTPIAVAVIVLILASVFGLYAWRQIQSISQPGNAPVASHPLVVPSLSPLPSPSPVRHPITVGVRATDLVWINVFVDGKAQYSDSGRFLQAGTQVFFTGFDIKITSGKAASTFITIDDRDLGAMGNGVVTREFKANP